jgi:hypothetical protein
MPGSEQAWVVLEADLEEKFEVMDTHLCQLEG